MTDNERLEQLRRESSDWHRQNDIYADRYSSSGMDEGEEFDRQKEIDSLERDIYQSS